MIYSSVRLLVVTLLVWPLSLQGQQVGGLTLPQQAAVEAGKGVEQYRKGHLQRALSHFETASEMDPGREDYAVNAGIVSEQLGQIDSAVHFFRRALSSAVIRKDFERVNSYSARVSALLVQEPTASYSKSQGVLLAELKKGEAEAISLYQSGEAGQAEVHLQQMIVEAGRGLGESDPQTQSLRMLLSEIYEASDNLPDAHHLAQQVSENYMNTLGPPHPLTQESLMVLAHLDELQGNYAAAANRLLAACTGSMESLGELHPQTGECFSRMGLMNLRQGDYAKSRFAYAKATRILKAVVGRQHPSWIQARIQQADLSRLTSDFAGAEMVLEKLMQQELSAPLQLEARGVLAQLYEDQGDYPGAEQQTREIMALESRSLGELHPNTITTLNNLAGLRRKQSRFLEAERGYQDALDRFEQTVGREHPSTIAVMNNLGLTLENQGLYDRAEPLLRSALKLSSRTLGESHPITLANMNNLALLHESQGSFEKSEPLYRKAMEILDGTVGETHPDSVAVRNNLGYLYLLQEKREEAAELFEEVLEVWQETLGEHHQKSLKGMNNLGRARHALEEYEEAEGLLSRALELRREVLGENHIDTLRSQHDLARLYLDLERFEESESLLEKTRRQDEEKLGEQHPYTLETLNTLVMLQEQTEQSEKAFETHQTLFERRNKFLDQMLWVTNENAREGYIRLHRPELNRYLTAIAQLEPEQAGEALLQVALFRKGLLLQVASQINQVSKLSEDPALTGISDALLKARKELAALTLSGPTEETATTFLETTHQLEVRIEELEGELGRVSARFRESAEEPAVEQLQESLPEGSALVDFMVYRQGEESLLQVAILARDEGEPPRFDHYLYEDLEGINEAIKEFRELIQDEDADDDEIMEFGMEVHERIWAPIAERIGEIGTVYVVPDGLLNTLPFNAMVDEEESYLLQSLDLHTLSSSRDLLPSNLPVAEGGYMIMAGPDYDTDEVTGRDLIESIKGKRSAAALQSMRGMSHGLRGLHFDPLPGAEKEGRLIEEQTIEHEVASRAILKKEAQEQVLREVEEPPEVLHIATHGFFLKPDEKLKKRLRKLQRGADLQPPPPGDNPLLRAGLAFSGLNANAPLLGEIDTDNDGVLTALEVLGLDLTGTRLAVLSACETGLGEIHEGEGVYGLRRSFQEAGVGAVVNSLWEVSDAGTQALMTGLYQRMLEGESTHEALRNTQLEMLDSDEWNYPYVWSAFFMVEQVGQSG